MKLENQVISLELAKEMKELGFKQESLFWWFKDYYPDGYWESGEWKIIDRRIRYQDDNTEIKDGDIISAYTVAELGEMLPKYWTYKFQKSEKRENTYFDLEFAGDWNIGGFDADTGLTGRKLAVDNYGPQIPIGGGAFSGKDYTKVDRSGAYMARKIALDLIKRYDAKEVLVKLAYSIGVAEPVMAIAEITQKDFDDGKSLIDLNKVKYLKYDLTPKGIKKFLKLDKPIYSKTAEWGHMGNGFEWDK